MPTEELIDKSTPESNFLPLVRSVFSSIYYLNLIYNLKCTYTNIMHLNKNNELIKSI